MQEDLQPFTIYYMHFVDERHIINNWNVCRDYACCVMAKDQLDAIEKTRAIALNQKYAKEIKVIGIGHGKEEWTKLPQPLTTDETSYREQAQSAIERARTKRIDLLEGHNLKYKFDL